MNLFLILSAIFTSIAWLIPMLTNKIKFKYFLFYTISNFGVGKNSLIYKISLLAANLFLTFHITQINSNISYYISIILVLSLLFFIFIDVKNNYKIHTFAGTIFFLTLSVSPSILRGLSFITLLPAISFLIAVIQVSKNKGDGLGVLLTIYTSAIALYIN